MTAAAAAVVVVLAVTAPSQIACPFLVWGERWWWWCDDRGRSKPGKRVLLVAMQSPTAD